MRRKKQITMGQRNAFYGRMFSLPWIIGFIVFFLIPIAQSIAFAFSKVSVTTEGFSLKFKGLYYFKYLILDEPDYIDTILSAVGNLAYSLPFIVIFSLIIAVILNREFKGRIIFRSIFFLPVIISTGIVVTFILKDDAATEMRSDVETISTFLGGFIDFEEILAGLGLPKKISDLLINYIEEIFNLLWSSGIQILLFISGLQAVPEQLYEVSRVEGATGWETFWYVTFPMLGNTLVLVIVFTAIDILTSTNNVVMESAFNLMNGQTYDLSAAMLWLYFLIVTLILVPIFSLFYTKCIRRWE